MQICEPVHVESLVFVERHAFYESSEVLVDAETLQVLGDGCLDALIEGGEVGAGVLFHLTLESVGLLLSGDISGDHD